MGNVDGYLLVDKPAGRSSASLTRQLGRILNARAGHLGTLDPLATGLLVVCIGKALKLVPYLQKGAKRYLAEISFGRATDSYDGEGAVTATGEVPEDLQGLVRKGLKRFSGEMTQFPPPYSAVKVDGVRLLKLARRGAELELPERRVTFYEITVKNWRPDGVVIEVSCSAGTYIRSLAHDLGKAINVPAHLASLRRLESHPFKVAEAVDGDELVADNAPVTSFIRPIEDFLPTLPQIDLTEAEVVTVGHGVSLPGSRVRAGACLLMDGPEKLVAIGESRPDEDRIKIKRVLVVT
jgi:tRNA pseudouridine55 synthase